MTLIRNLKTRLRELLPKRYQVPVKYLVNKLLGHLEEEMSLLSLLVNNQDLVIDIGGNRGIYTYKLWKLGAKVEAFEPNPMCSSVLSAWADGKTSINIHSVALSNVSGEANLRIPVDPSGIEHDSSASLEHEAFAETRDELVPLRTLDSYGFQNVVFIKIDVEGHEYSVIEGAVEILVSSRPALLIEIEERHSSRPINETFDKLLEIGYCIYFMGPGGLRAIEDFNVDRDQSIFNLGSMKGRYINNFLFLHRDRLASGAYREILSDYK